MASISPYGKRFISYLRREQIRRLIASKARIDGREVDQVRPVEVKTGVVKTADGSAEVKLGKTHVVAGVKIGLGQPFPDAPDEGVLVVNAEVLPHVENGEKMLRECGLAVRRASGEPLKNVGVAALSRRLVECLYLDDERLGALFVILCTSLGLSCPSSPISTPRAARRTGRPLPAGR